MRILDLMRRLPSNRFVFEFCSLSGQCGELDEEIRALGGKVHYCTLRSIFFPFTFWRLLRSGHYVVVHSHVHYFSGCIIMMAHLFGVSGRIAHFRSSSDGKMPTVTRRIQTVLMKYWITRYASHILAVGQDVMEASWGMDWSKDDRFIVIPNGLNTTPFESPVDPIGVRREFGMPDHCRLIVHVGRMSLPKNNIRLSSILGGCLAANTNLFALFVGKESEGIKDAMILRLRECGVIDRVRFAGVRCDVPRILLGSDLLLFPSLWEGLPGVVLEACAAGTPVLASDIPGIQELASVFPCIQMLNLKAPDFKWIQYSEALLNNKPSINERRAALDHFRKSPYNIECCLESHLQVWERYAATMST